MKLKSILFWYTLEKIDWRQIWRLFMATFLAKLMTPMNSIVGGCISTKVSVHIVPENLVAKATFSPHAPVEVLCFSSFGV